MPRKSLAEIKAELELQFTRAKSVISADTRPQSEPQEPPHPIAKDWSRDRKRWKRFFDPDRRM
jgi:hypothetical protein